MKINSLKNSRHFSFSQLHIENTSNANIYIYSTFNNLKLYSLEHAFIQSNNCSNQIQIFNFQQETIQSNPFQRIISQTLFIIYIYTHTHLKNKRHKLQSILFHLWQKSFLPVISSFCHTRKNGNGGRGSGEFLRIILADDNWLTKRARS